MEEKKKNRVKTFRYFIVNEEIPIIKYLIRRGYIKLSFQETFKEDSKTGHWFKCSSLGE